MTKEKKFEEYTFRGKHDDETVHLVFRQHPITMRGRLIIFLLAVLLFALPLQFRPLETWPWWFLLGGFIFGLLIMGHRVISWFYSLFIITNERFIKITQKGFFNRRVSDISHGRIQSVNYEVKGIQASLLGYGTLIIQMYTGSLILPYISKPERVHQLMVKQMRNTPPVDPSSEIKSNKESE